VPANAAYLITHVLSDDTARVSMFGANSSLNLAGTAVKSGLSDNARDAWTIGYSPNVVTGVWVGNANNRPMPGATSSYAAAPIWRQFMQSAMVSRPSSGFPVPNDVQFVRVCAETGLLPGRSCRSTVTEVFLPGRAPTTSGESFLPSPRRTPEPTRTPANPSQRRLVTPTPDEDEDRTPSRRPRASPTPRPTEPFEPPVNPRRRDRGRD
jgi:membrane carboxypeptidase/penicillin-binding protein